MRGGIWTVVLCLVCVMLALGAALTIFWETL